MGSFIGMEDCPRCGHESLFVDNDCKRWDYDSFCQLCGHGNHFGFKRDDNFDMIYEKISYQRKKVFFAVRNYESEEILWKKTLFGIENLTTDLIFDFLNNVEFDWTKDAPLGYRNVFAESDSGELEQLFFIGNSFEIVNDETVILLKAIAEEDSTVGYGLIIVTPKNGNEIVYIVQENDSKEDALNKLNDILSSISEENIDSITATWFNEETNQLEFLIESPEINTEDESLEDLVDDISNMVDNQDN